MAPHSSTLAWKIPWTEGLVGCSPWGHEESDTTERLHFHFSLWCIGEGNGNPLQCSCLENPRDGGAWWAAVSGVAQSQTWLKRLSSSSSVYSIMQSANSDSFTTFFLIWMLFICFSCLIDKLGLSVLCWIEVEWVGILVLFLIWEGKLFNFSPLRIMFAVGIPYMAFIMLRYVSSIFTLLRVIF